MSKRFSSHALKIVQDAALPDHVELLPAPPFAGRDGRGPYHIDHEAILAAFAEFGMPLPIDYEHQSISAALASGPVPAAGWIVDLTVREQGSVWAKVEWTARAMELISAGEYRYLSPVFGFLPDSEEGESGLIVEIYGAGLTNLPNLHLAELTEGLPEPPESLYLAVARAGFATRTERASKRTNSMKTGERSMKLLLDALGLAAGATEADALAALNALKSASASAHAFRAAMSAATATPADADVPAVLAAAAKVDPAQFVPIAAHKQIADELSQIKRDAHAAKVASAVAAAQRAGKVTPAMHAWASEYAGKDLPGFEAYIAAAPVVVDPAAAAPDGTPPASTHALDDADRHVMKLLCIDEKAYAAA